MMGVGVQNGSNIPTDRGASPPGHRTPEEIPEHERLWAMACHLSTLAGYAIPFGNMLGPLVIWLIRKDEFPFVDSNGREALNVQITFTLLIVVPLALLIIPPLACILIPYYLAMTVFWFVVVIMATIRTNRGERHVYPMRIPFV